VDLTSLYPPGILVTSVKWMGNGSCLRLFLCLVPWQAGGSLEMNFTDVGALADNP